MSLPIYVDAYSGYKANERPRQFTLDEEIYEIDAVPISGTSRQRPTSKFRAPKGRLVCSATTKR